ncbi:MAG: HAD family hydrolase [Alphaproteobacteria bacterium]|nr:HAD family hydrolase [Alphaproteobacteria bacterium]MCB9975876.1 HAD family hydrolase [Rhodospirillales bacterium]
MISKASVPKAVFFDWDGTLADSYAYLNEAHSHVLAELGFEPFKKDEFKDYFGKPREILYTKIYKHRSEEAKILFEKYVNENCHKLTYVSGADTLLKTIFDLGLPMGIVSNKKGSIVRREIGHFGWNGYFPTIVAAGEASEDKPSGAPLLMAIEQAGLAHLNKADIWYVGDTETDLRCARDANCPVLLIAPYGIEKLNMREYNPIKIADNCHHLLEFLVAISR